MKVKVPVFRTSPTQSVTIDPAATVGAQIGVNMLMPDGTLATTAKLQALFGSTPSTGSSIDTTDDIDEGAYHLWFTDIRAQNAVGGILADSANVTLTYDTGVSITADLTDLADSGTGTLQAITRDDKGRITGARGVTTDDLAPALDSAFFADILQTESGAALLTESGDLLTVD